MKTTSVIAAAAALMAGSAIAAPLNARADLIAADIIAKIAPKSTGCSGDTANECRNNNQVGNAFIQAFVDYQIYDPKLMASIISLTAFESGDFQYKKNLQSSKPDQTVHWGQGSSNMQMFEFNLQFAKSIPDLAAKVDAIGGTDSMAQKNQVLDLVTDDAYNFKTGPWYFMESGKCEAAKPAFQGSDADAAWKAHMECVGVSTDDATRVQYWNNAKQAFGLA